MCLNICSSLHPQLFGFGLSADFFFQKTSGIEVGKSEGCNRKAAQKILNYFSTFVNYSIDKNTYFSISPFLTSNLSNVPPVDAWASPLSKLLKNPLLLL
mmetsp:Transcript_3789/g.5596  ORF Transcript_3789/g.5596 Transcript_3789/m.5596 type:complete len:99 (-) Transcript_3789:409-705(-)